jgi:hypothetical protein
MTPDRLDDWHRLFGLTLTDVFSDTPWRVELEKDLAMQRQRLDVVIIEQTAPDGSAADLPDGFDALRRHNLLTYKSKQEPLDGWALDELIGHYVNYRKLLSPKPGLLPESDFQLYAVATRHPQGLARQRRLQSNRRVCSRPTPAVSAQPDAGRTADGARPVTAGRRVQILHARGRVQALHP